MTDDTTTRSLKRRCVFGMTQEIELNGDKEDQIAPDSLVSNVTGTNSARLKRRRLVGPTSDTSVGDQEPNQIPTGTPTAHGSGHVYSSPISLDGNARAVFGNVINIGRHFHVASSEIYQRAFLDKIYFEGIERRRHNRTTHPIILECLDQVWTTSLMGWLQTPEPFFWINVTAGSGKTVLTEYLSDNFRTLRALQLNREKWVILHFRCNFGATNRGNSILAILRSLLYQMIRQLPQVHNLVHSAYFVDHFRSDNVQDCLDALCDIARYSSTKVCIFGDGVDQFAGASASELLEVMQSLQERTGIKICLAGRPACIITTKPSDHKMLTIEHTKWPRARSHC